MIYEPKHHIFWENFNCDPLHKGLACFLSDCSYDCVRDSDLIKMETISALDPSRPPNKVEALEKICNESEGKFQMIRYSLENVTSILNTSARMMNFIDVNRQRAKNDKLFYATFAKKNPFYFALVYTRTKEGNHLYLRT